MNKETFLSSRYVMYDISKLHLLFSPISFYLVRLLLVGIFLMLVSCSQDNCCTPSDDNTAPVITLFGQNPTILIEGTSYKEAGATAMDNIDGNVTIIIHGKIDVNKVGTYSIVYTSTDKAGNKASFTRRVIVKAKNKTDIKAPIITLLGKNPTILTEGTSYKEAGATAMDNIDGNVTVFIHGKVDANKVGTYSIVYTSTDKAGNKASFTRRVIVKAKNKTDIKAPIITLLGKNPTILTEGTSYKEAGATAMDNIDGKVTVFIHGKVDVNKVGTYSIVYTSNDKAGNKASLTRKVIVKTGSRFCENQSSDKSSSIAWDRKKESFTSVVLTSKDTNLLKGRGIFPPVSLPLQKKFKLSSRGNRQTITGNFIDSQGRNLLYRLSVPDGLDPTIPQKIMLYFHGNNTGTQNDMLDAFFNGNESLAIKHGLIPIVVASPELSASGSRTWKDEDKLLIYEFLKNGLEQNFDIDMTQVFFLGASAGTCFLNEFIQEYGENYGGGLSAACGCFYPLNPVWNPSKEFISAFKVYVSTTTDDFLYGTSQAGYGYYKYTIGLNTRGSFDQSGSHCSNHWAQTKTALDWLTGVSNIPDEEFRPYWKRISLMTEVKGLTIDSNNTLWAVQQTNTSTAKLWSSTDKGKNWQSVNECSIQAKDLDSSGGNLFMSTKDNGLLKSSNSGASFTSIVQNPTFPWSVVTDTQNHLYRDGFPVQFSEDQGETWRVLNTNSNAILNRESIFLGSSPKLITSTKSEPVYGKPIYGPNNGNFYIDSINPSESSRISDTESGSIFSVTWDGQTLWGLGDRISSRYYFSLFKSTNMGSTWAEVPLPFDQHYKAGAKISAIGIGKIVLHGGSMANLDYSSWFSDDDGQTWIRLPGLETAVDGVIVTKDGENIYYTDGEAIFRFIGSAIEQSKGRYASVPREQ